MAKRKLERFAEIETFANVFQNPFEMKGKWRSDYFKNENPIVLELGCGRGEYTVDLTQRYPDTNFIGVDVKGNRLWRGAKTCLEQNLPNAAFLRIQIETIESFFDEAEVDEIWITFPDPHLPNGKAKKRLTSPRFLSHYRKILKKDGVIHLKTDSRELYDYTMEVINEQKLNLIEETSDLYASEILNEVLEIKTTYEKKFLAVNKKINYIRFSL